MAISLLSQMQQLLRVGISLQEDVIIELVFNPYKKLKNGKNLKNNHQLLQ